MSIVPPNIDQMLEAEVDQGSPLSEQLMNKISANINALIEQSAATEFLSSGSYVVPENITVIAVLACGGGGGGASGQTSSAPFVRGGQGGGGAMPVFSFFNVVANETITVSIGSGGAGAAQPPLIGGEFNSGLNGAETLLTGSSSGVICRANGGRGANDVADNSNGATFSNIWAPTGGFVRGGGGGNPNDSLASTAGQNTAYANGGGGGANTASGGGGGGGGAGIGAGAAGSVGPAPFSSGGAGASAGANTGGGGGGGSSGSNSGGNAFGGPGGNGGSGYCLIINVT